MLARVARENLAVVILREDRHLAKRVEVQFEGQTVQADQLTFETQKEPWAEYKLEDGTVLKFKVVLGNVARLVDRYKPDGEPIYVLSLAGVPLIEVPRELKRGVQPAPPPENQRS